ncbi:hypothetical protein H5368_04220 [Luteimonas sp. MC1782]|uniref:hypothetical protein n=1 Tax=Luteimonas sp. MC1782 TaxID=2760305 RepID=UPI001602B3E2|nr:hypothetical protein [Luteimonas sp. MC1782]MBB1472230.1 hypothetical protein [Luteimonas sp. MC1782]
MRLPPLKESALWLYTNLRGWRTRRKLVVFESDDWGAIRMPGQHAYDALLAAGIRVDRSPYDRLDCLERREDLDALFQVLDTYRDARGGAAKFTFNTIMGNPDFEAIRRDGFERFHHQHIFDSYRDYHGDNLERVWRDAMLEGLIKPQFHGREHLNSMLWMRDLTTGVRETRAAFEYRFYGLRAQTSSRWQHHYKAAHCAESPDEMREIGRIATDGLDIFEQTFGFRSSTFVACNYVLPAELEGHLAGQGISMIQTQRGYVQPQPGDEGRRKLVYRYPGQANSYGQRYSVRNILFEPYLDGGQDWCERAIGEMALAFRLGKPAVICTHRVNYVGGMDVQHRDSSLAQLERFLSAMLQRWPDLEFISSDELAHAMGAAGA